MLRNQLFAVCVCLKHIAGAKQGSMVITHRDKEEDVAEECGHMEVEYHFSGTNILVLVSGHKDNTV